MESQIQEAIKYIHNFPNTKIAKVAQEFEILVKAMNAVEAARLKARNAIRLNRHLYIILFCIIHFSLHPNHSPQKFSLSPCFHENAEERKWGFAKSIFAFLDDSSY
jgi:hypothetical protein